MTTESSKPREPQRKQFEEWYESDAMPSESDWFRRDPADPDEYDMAMTAVAYRAWCAAAPAAPAWTDAEVLRGALERVIGMCGDRDRCLCGRPTGIQAVVAAARAGLAAAAPAKEPDITDVEVQDIIDAHAPSQGEAWDMASMLRDAYHLRERRGTSHFCAFDEGHDPECGLAHAPQHPPQDAPDVAELLLDLQESEGYVSENPNVHSLMRLCKRAHAALTAMARDNKRIGDANEALVFANAAMARERDHLNDMLDITRADRDKAEAERDKATADAEIHLAGANEFAEKWAKATALLRKASQAKTWGDAQACIDAALGESHE